MGKTGKIWTQEQIDALVKTVAEKRPLGEFCGANDKSEQSARIMVGKLRKLGVGLPKIVSATGSPGRKAAWCVAAIPKGLYTKLGVAQAAAAG